MPAGTANAGDGTTTTVTLWFSAACQAAWSQVSVSPTDNTPPTGAAYSLAIFATAPWPLVPYFRAQVCCFDGATDPSYTNMVPDNIYATQGWVVPLAGIPPQLPAGPPACTPYH